MKWSEINQRPCPVARGLAIIGDGWTLLIIKNLFAGLNRFSEIQKSCEISRPRLSERLKRLKSAGVITKVAYEENKLRQKYILTEKGLDLLPILISIEHWGSKWESNSKKG